ncbi:unnamed protein product [Phytophthora lilii]|uniref:Unnamed protein product n=1 Tax=Phytophthora lilii TaxID=2077276 RepID=A0A9W6UDN7_9STRA|nr:unnamed protein product [Phytophthora lilii]
MPLTSTEEDSGDWVAPGAATAAVAAESSLGPPSASSRRSRSPSAPPDTGENPRFTCRSRSRSPTDMETQVVYSGDESDAEDKVSKPTGDKASPGLKEVDSKGVPGDGDTKAASAKHLTLAEGRERARETGRTEAHRFAVIKDKGDSEQVLAREAVRVLGLRVRGRGCGRAPRDHQRSRSAARALSSCSGVRPA